MSKALIIIKRILKQEKTRQYMAAVVMIGLVSSLAISNSSATLAGDRQNNSVNLLALEATINPNGVVVEEDEIDTSLRNSIYIEAICLPGTFCLDDDRVLTIKPDFQRVIVTAYSSSIDQTDHSPFITANGTFVRDGVVACNFLPFGTKVKFPEIYGDKIFVVEDRMAKKNSHKMDIWMPSRNLALQFGVRTLAIEVVE